MEWDGTLSHMMNSIIPSLKETSFSYYHVHPDREHFNPEGLVLSLEFLESIRALTDSFPVIAICGPLKVNGKQQVATILSLALTTKPIRIY
jgi:hypothetical protein